MSYRSAPFALLLLLLAAGALAGCSSAEGPAAARAAGDFLRLARSEPGQACVLLAPRTAEQLADDGDGACATGLADAGVPEGDEVLDVTVSGRSAQVVLAGQAVFLARFDSGWRVTAAGCTRTSTDDSVPYHCMVEGG